MNFLCAAGEEAALGVRPHTEALLHIDPVLKAAPT